MLNGRMFAALSEGLSSWFSLDGVMPHTRGQHYFLNSTWWHIATVSALGMLRQEDKEFKDCLGYMAITTVSISTSKL